MPCPANSSQPFVRNRFLIGGLILYACAFAFLLRNKSFDAAGAVVVLIVFGIVFPFIGWVTTRRAVPLSVSVKPSKAQLVVLIAYIVALSLYLIGGPQWIDQHLPSSWIDSVRIKFFITLARKLIVFVAIPFAIFRFGFGYRIRDFGIQREGYARSAVVIYPSSLLWAEFLWRSNIFSVAVALHFDMDSLLYINCSSACRFASFGFSSKPD